MQEKKTIKEILNEGIKLLSSPSPSSIVEMPQLDASLLMGEVYKKRREELILRENDIIDKNKETEFFSLIKRRRDGECIAYILGKKEFRGLNFTVNPSVLVPRPDTEILVEAVLEHIDQINDHSKKSSDSDRVSKLSLLDLCTGSGSVGIAIKKERPFLSVTASDISPDALTVAGQNAAALLAKVPREPEAIIHLIHSDLFENITGKFDIIVSNPPYIPAGDLAALPPEVQKEPHLALDGGEDGLIVIKKIIREAPGFLVPKGRLFLEADPGQMPSIRHMLLNKGFEDIKTHKDLADRDRVISAKMQ